MIKKAIIDPRRQAMNTYHLARKAQQCRGNAHAIQQYQGFADIMRRSCLEAMLTAPPMRRAGQEPEEGLVLRHLPRRRHRRSASARGGAGAGGGVGGGGAQAGPLFCAPRACATQTPAPLSLLPAPSTPLQMPIPASPGTVITITAIGTYFVAKVF